MADALTDAYAAIVAEARASVAAGRVPDEAALAGRIRAVGGPEAAERRALQQLERIAAVHRARTALGREPAPPARPAPRPRGPLLRPRPTISANMEVRREGDERSPVLAWDPAPGVASWEVRVSERPSGRGDYVVRETRMLPGTATATEVPLGERPLRLHLLGRGRDGRLLRRAVVSALTRESWGERWQRRASAS
ncbi:MAG TPA: hypothetical protein VLB86_11045 [Gaiellaceae bacterium]|nr:hypothetical protein [Gaiellaceae bacterium]